MTGHIGMGLTPGQAKVLAVIKRSFAERGIAPTMAQIARECGWASTSCGWGVVQRLIDRGHLSRDWSAPKPRYRFIPVSALTWPEVA